MNEAREKGLSHERRMEIWPDGPIAELPNGFMLFRKYCQEVGCWEYFSDEISGGVFVWNEALVDVETLLTAVVESRRRDRMEEAILGGWEQETIQ